MQKVALGIFTAALLSGSAVAADLPLKAPPAAPAVVGYNWTGFYLGGHIGGGFEHHTVTNVGTINSANFPFGDQSSGNESGVLGGVQAGFDWQFHPNWLIGVGGDFSWSGIEGDEDRTGVVNPLVVNHVHREFKWLATLTGRLGYLPTSNWLLYAKGGVAWGRSEANSDTTNPAGVIVTTTTSRSTRTGWTVGAGTEYQFIRNWSAFLEYDFIDFGTKTGSSLVTLGTTAPVLTGVTLLRDNDSQISVVKAGINYRF